MNIIHKTNNATQNLTNLQIYQLSTVKDLDDPRLQNHSNRPRVFELPEIKTRHLHVGIKG